MPYLNAAELGQYAQIEGEDIRLSNAVAAAEADVDEYCGWGTGGFVKASTASARLFGPKHVTEHGCLLTMTAGFVDTTGLAIKTDDDDDGVFETTWGPSDYELAPVGNYFAGVDGFPFFEIRAVGSKTFPTCTNRRGVIEVTALWGWGGTEAPDAVKSAIEERALAVATKPQDGRTALGFRAGGRDHDFALHLDKYRHPRKLASFA